MSICDFFRRPNRVRTTVGVSESMAPVEVRLVPVAPTDVFRLRCATTYSTERYILVGAARPLWDRSYHRTAEEALAAAPPAASILIERIPALVAGDEARLLTEYSTTVRFGVRAAPPPAKATSKKGRS